MTLAQLALHLGICSNGLDTTCQLNQDKTLLCFFCNTCSHLCKKTHIIAELIQCDFLTVPPLPLLNVMKSFIYKSPYFTQPFLILVLNKGGGTVKKSPYMYKT